MDREQLGKPHKGWQFESAEDLSSKAKREEMPKGDFADPAHKKFPIPDKQHAELAMKYIRHASPEVKKRIKAMAADFGVGPQAATAGQESAAAQIGRATVAGKITNTLNELKSQNIVNELPSIADDGASGNLETRGGSLSLGPLNVTAPDVKAGGHASEETLKTAGSLAAVADNLMSDVSKGATLGGAAGTLAGAGAGAVGGIETGPGEALTIPAGAAIGGALGSAAGGVAGAGKNVIERFMNKQRRPATAMADDYPGQGIKNTRGVISESNKTNPQFISAYKKELDK